MLVYKYILLIQLSRETWKKSWKFVGQKVWVVSVERLIERITV